VAHLPLRTKKVDRSLRFIAEGPELSDDLLVARDEGKVIFFCGSGVSRAKANLPDFFGLARGVLDKLRALPDSAPHQLMQIAATVQANKISGVGSIVAADRIFGLLERDFSPADIDRAVGAVLKPALGVDASAHQILLDLSRTANGKIQLVTTNFDLLFEEAAPRLRTWTPDDLPDLQRGTFDGIVHLHGMLDDRAPAWDVGCELRKVGWWKSRPFECRVWPRLSIRGLGHTVHSGCDGKILGRFRRLRGR
jgi:hypothetical protein